MERKKEEKGKGWRGREKRAKYRLLGLYFKHFKAFGFYLAQIAQLAKKKAIYWKCQSLKVNYSDQTRNDSQARLGLHHCYQAHRHCGREARQ